MQTFKACNICSPNNGNYLLRKEKGEKNYIQQISKAFRMI